MIERLTDTTGIEDEVAAWDEYVARSSGATCYHLHGWRDVATRAYQLENVGLISRVRPGAPIRGVLPLFVVHRAFHRYVTTGMFGAYGRVLADDASVERELLDEACRFTNERGADYLHVKLLGEPPAGHGLERHDLWTTARLPLAGGMPTVMRRMRKGVRAAVRQAERAGLSVRWGREACGALYEVLAENMHRKGTPIYGRTFVDAILDVFGSRAEVVTVWGEDNVVGGALTLVFDGTLYIPFASSRPSEFRRRPNNLLFHRIAERACSQGFSTLDFGSSLDGSSSLEFKRHWGAEPFPVTSLVYTPATKAKRLIDASGAGVRAGVELWKHLPRAVADAFGPYVSRMMV